MNFALIIYPHTMSPIHSVMHTHNICDSKTSLSSSELRSSGMQNNNITHSAKLYLLPFFLISVTEYFYYHLKMCSHQLFLIELCIYDLGIWCKMTHYMAIYSHVETKSIQKHFFMSSEEAALITALYQSISQIIRCFFLWFIRSENSINL